MPRGFAVFDTAIGLCGMAWSDAGVTRVQLPESTPQRTRDRLRSHGGGAEELPPPPAIARAIDKVAALLAGAQTDLSDIALDVDGVPPFAENPPGLPAAAITRWHGTMSGKGLRPSARPTARAASGAPIAVAMSPYVRMCPGSMRRAAV